MILSHSLLLRTRPQTPPSGLYLGFKPNAEQNSIFAWIGSKTVTFSNTNNSSLPILGNRFSVYGAGTPKEALHINYEDFTVHEVVVLDNMLQADFRMQISDTSATVYTASHDIIISDDDPDNGVGDNGMTWLSTDGTKSWFKYNGACGLFREAALVRKADTELGYMPR